MSLGSLTAVLNRGLNVNGARLVLASGTPVLQKVVFTFNFSIGMQSEIFFNVQIELCRSSKA